MASLFPKDDNFLSDVFVENDFLTPSSAVCENLSIKSNGSNVKPTSSATPDNHKYGLPVSTLTKLGIYAKFKASNERRAISARYHRFGALLSACNESNR